MTDRPSIAPPAPVRRSPLPAAIFLISAVLMCAIYANLSLTVTNPAHYRFFPPFKPYVNANMNHHLGAEYYNIAKALARGEGFANPFPGQTGPTAWMPPLLSALEAGLLWICDGDRDSVMAVVIFFQVSTLIGTGLLVLALVHQTGHRVGAWVAAGVFVAGLVYDFRFCFQVTHDCWLVLLALDLVIAGFCWLRPLRRGSAALAWGTLGGACALVNPIVALVWGLLSLVTAFQHRAWSRLAIAVLTAGLILVPWTVRNYLVFGRLVPVKSNLAYELYQSQCLQPDGLIQRTTFATHPYGAGIRERQEYKALGEMAFLDRKREQFWEAVRADPLEFIDRVACRFLGATLWYVPFDRTDEARRPWVVWLSRFIHPLPFLGLLLLLCTAFWERLSWAQWTVIGVYLIYLLPYIGASYYERYAAPLLGVKVLLVIWTIDRLLAFWPRSKTAASRQTAALRPPHAVGRGRAVAEVP